ncbi:tetratricopeptide repeat protein [candidate division WOR-3 bacterium]|nr:tetratricopeptide repeat protein [candidate division WOR-3 bacterium]
MPLAKTTEARALNKKIVNILAVILLVAFAFRFIHHLEMQAHDPIYEYPIIDSKEYVNNAEYIVETTWLGPSWPFFHPPFYTYVLAAIFWLFGISITIVRILQILLDCVNILLLFLLARKTFDPAIALISCALYALYIPLIQFSVELLPPVLSIFLLLVSVLSLLIYLDRARTSTRSLWWLCIAGASYGLLIITLPNFLVCLPIIAILLYFFMHWIAIRQRILLIGVFCVLAMIPAIATTVRNIAYTGEKVFISYNGGVNFYIGNNPDIYTTVAIPPGVEWEKFTMIPYERERIENFARASAYWYQQGFTYIMQHPLSWLWLMVKKTVLFFNAHEFPRNFDLAFFGRYSAIMKLPIVKLNVLLALGMTGMIIIAARWRAVIKKRALVLIGAIFFSYALSIILFFIAARYRLPLVPFLTIFAAYALHLLFRSKKRAITILIAACALVLFCLVSVHPFAHTHPYTIPVTKTYALIGATLFDQGDNEQAYEYLTLGLEEPADRYTYDLHHQLGLLLSKQGKTDQSIAHYRSSLEHKADNFAVWNDLASEYMTAGQLDSALVCYEQARQLAPCCAKVYLNLVEVYFAAQEYDRIIPVLESYFHACPSPHPIISYTLGKFYMQILHDWDKAIFHIEQAIGYPHGFELTVDVYNNLGICYFYRNEFDKADRTWRKGLRLDPDNESIKNNLKKLDALNN